MPTVPEAVPVTWSMVAESLTRPYPVSIPMIVLLALVPLYIFIPGVIPGRTLHVPELALDRVVPLRPAWALVHGALYLILNVIAGILLAAVAYLVFLRNDAGDRVPELDRRLAPLFALGTVGIVGLGVAGFWVAYRLKGPS